MCGIAGAGRAGRTAGAAGAAAMVVATRRSLPRAAVDERSLAKKRKVPPSQKAKSDGDAVRRASARYLSLSCSTIGRQNDFRRAARLARLLAISHVTRRLVAYRPRAPKRLSLTCSVPPTAGGALAAHRSHAPSLRPVSPRHTRRGMPPQLAAHSEDNQCSSERGPRRPRSDTCACEHGYV